nr:MAG TPA: hypothetical protein [Caudoviricetes sp.]
MVELIQVLYQFKFNTQKHNIEDYVINNRHS